MFHPINLANIVDVAVILGLEGFTSSKVLNEVTLGGNTYVTSDPNRRTIDLARVDGMSVIQLEIDLESTTLKVRTASETVTVVGYHYNGGQLSLRESNDPVREFLTVDHNHFGGSVIWHRDGNRTQTFETPRASRDRAFQNRIDQLVDEVRSLTPKDADDAVRI
jgi:hypothetical protein